jgi:endonuclease YncB( thermonuclease family)
MKLPDFIGPVLGAIIVLTALAWCRPAEGKTIKGRAINVADGDTMTVVEVGKEKCQVYILRLAGIDAPEKRQPYGKAARQYAARWAYGRTLTVTLGERDKYKRWVANVCRGASSPYRCLPYQLVRKGLAWWYKAYSKDKRLERAEKKARVEKVGLWKQESPVAPWLFRRK